MLCSLLFRLSRSVGLWSYCFPPTRRFCTPNTHVQMEEMDHGSLGANALIADGSLTTIRAA